MLVYVALALAVAFVLRRGDGPGVLARDRARRDRDLLVRARDATRSRPLRHVRRSRHRVSAGRAARILERARAAGDARRSRRARLRGARTALDRSRFAAAAALPIMVHDAVLHVLARRVGRALVGLVVAVGSGPAPAAAALDRHSSRCDPGLACIAYASRLDALTTEDAPRRVGGAGGASRCGGRLRCHAASSGLLAWAAREVSRRVAVSRTRSQGASTSRWPVLSVACGRSVL